jgi:mono/diheme cytochrome c family protein
MSEDKDFHNRGGLLALLASIVFVAVFFIYIVFIQAGVDLGENVIEPVAAGTPKYDLSSEKQPWVASENIIIAGQKIYALNCASCHGAKGDLVGGIPNARNLIEGQWKAGVGSIAHYKVLQNGIAGTSMVSFKAQLKPHERWALVAFIDSITNNKSKDKPEDIASFAAQAD